MSAAQPSNCSEQFLLGGANPVEVERAVRCALRQPDARAHTEPRGQFLERRDHPAPVRGVEARPQRFQATSSFTHLRLAFAMSASARVIQFFDRSAPLIPSLGFAADARPSAGHALDACNIDATPAACSSLCMRPQIRHSDATGGRIVLKDQVVTSIPSASAQGKPPTSHLSCMYSVGSAGAAPPASKCATGK